MEAKNDTAAISDIEFMKLLQAAKQKDPQAVIQLIDLYKNDILRISKYVHLAKEDAVSTIILEFLEFIQNEKRSEDTNLT
ncbi:hypothetical protein [Paenibacillus zanthoxyli]|uniref:hypothetical protein n=1 Tax=Paenibacillus zanthoxyli TaxID=369399 RepID=UPI00046F2715|nr:hypothetical protein [Paenibacillus zanthoxyli]